MTQTNPSDLLVETDWLAAHLGDLGLRVFDCSVRLVPDPAIQYRVEDCRAEYRASHIPGAAYIDLHNDLSDKRSDLRFMAPSAEDFGRAMSRYGVGERSRVVLYAKTTWYWATRVWWMLRADGFDNAAILNGGWQKWETEGRPVATGDEHYPPADFVARPRPGLFCGKEAVLAALDDPRIAIVNALTPEQHAGTGGTTFTRAGHISGSVNVSSKALVDENNVLLPLDEIRRRFAAAGVLDAERLIHYCGGGISATGNAFAMTLLGRGDNMSVYDGSLNEWGSDPALPMQTGAAASAGSRSP